MAASALQETEGLELTAEMIEAGVKVLYDSGAIENWCSGADRLLVGDIYKTMLAVRNRESMPKRSFDI